MVSILAYGGYVPRLRLSREAIVTANSWFNPALKAHMAGERSICNWDEDPLTMAVAAARDCLTGVAKESVTACHLASTTLPFVDRQNAGVVAAAAGLPETATTMDVTGSQRAATTALAAACRDGSGRTLLIASEKREARSGAPQEALYGDGAAALLIGPGPGIARLVASAGVAVDFVDHYRAPDHRFEYGWEERWIRDEGYQKIVPRALEPALAEAGISGAEIDHFVMPCVYPAVTRSFARTYGIRPEAVSDTLQAVMGEAGAAHPLVMLTRVLEQARPGQKIVLVGFGQGADALVFEVEEGIARLEPRIGIGGHLARGRPETNYQKYLAMNGLVDQEHGKRAEIDGQTALSTLYRKRDMVTSLIGGVCRTCGTRQFPKSALCVNPNCGEYDSQDDYPFADEPARVLTWSADHLVFVPTPPAHYGMVQFDGGGRFMADFTDVAEGEVEVGMDMRMEFRIKEMDSDRGFRKYFWKAAPARQG